MRTKTAFGLTAALTLAFILAAQYKSAPDRPSDFRDAVISEGAVEQLQKAVPGDRDLNQPAVPSPQEAEPAAPQAPESGGAAAQSAADDQGVERIFSENDPWHKRLAQALGINYPCTVETKRLGRTARSNGVTKLTLDDGRVKESVVVKQYSSLSLANEWYMKIMSLSAVSYDHDAVKMFNNGVAMNEKFRKAGLKTLEIVLTDALTDPKKPIVVTKFLKWTDMSSILRAAFQGDTDALQKIGQIGSALAAVHRNNLSVGDLHSGNVVFANGEPYFIDVDRARVGEGKGWDIALLFYQPILIVRIPAQPQAWALAARTFLQGYLAGGGDAGIVKEALSRKYIAPLAPLYATRGRSATRAVRLEMKKAAGEGPAEESDEALGLAP